jgi:acyl-coenzyme A synthetase/AMP-(fatty) acid ligase
MQDKINQLIAAAAAADAPFICGGQRMAQIHAQALKIRTALAPNGRSGTPVCLCTEDRAQVSAALLAALAGGPSLILPHAFSQQALLETQQVLPYDRALVDQPQPLPAGVSALDLNQLPPAGPGAPGPNPLGPEDVWVYLFTGGSTGKPTTWTKTVRNLLAEAHNLVETFHITPQEVFLATVPPHHIYGLLYSVLMPLVAGAQVVAETPSFPHAIVHALDQTHASVLVSIPAHYRALKSHPIANHRLGTAFSSAGALAPEDDQAFYQATGVAIAEVYGSTETGGIAFRRRARGQSALTPFACVDCTLDDERLWVRSSFLSPELARNNAGYFQTADRVALDQGRDFNLLGRCDGIVKVGGKRVDLTAVQQALKQIPGVRDAYVLSRAVHKGRENEILALVEGDLTVEALRALLQPTLEPYAQPRRIHVVTKMPLSKVGKYDRTEIENIFRHRR